MGAPLSIADAIPLLFGLGCGLIMFSLFALRRRRDTARRVSIFVGAPLQVAAAPTGSISRAARFRDLPRTIVPGPSEVQTLLKVIVVAGLVVGALFGWASGFAVAAFASIG